MPVSSVPHTVLVLLVALLASFGCLYFFVGGVGALLDGSMRHRRIQALAALCSLEAALMVVTLAPALLLWQIHARTVHFVWHESPPAMAVFAAAAGIAAVWTVPRSICRHLPTGH